MLDFLIDLDTDIFLFFNSLHFPLFDHFMKMFTGKLIWAPMYAAILFILYRRFGWRVATVYVLGTVLVIALADQICATAIRPYVERLRPSNLANPIVESVHIVGNYRGGSYGFPSCHAANSFALATYLAFLFSSRRFTIFILLWAFVNSYSRLYLGVHYPGDLVVGGIIGSIIAVAVYFLAKYVARKVTHPHRYYLNSERGQLVIFGRSLGVYRLSDLMIAVGCTISLVILSISLIRWV